MSPIHASVICQIRWLHWFVVPFRENSIVLELINFQREITKVYHSEEIALLAAGGLIILKLFLQLQTDTFDTFEVCKKPLVAAKENPPQCN